MRHTWLHLTLNAGEQLGLCCEGELRSDHPVHAGASLNASSPRFSALNVNGYSCCEPRKRGLPRVRRACVTRGRHAIDSCLRVRVEKGHTVSGLISRDRKMDRDR